MSGYFRCEIKIVSRCSIRRDGSVGHNSAVNAAAYIAGKAFSSGSAIEGAAYISGKAFSGSDASLKADYTHKKGVLLSRVVLPAHAPERLQDPEALWNAVEDMEGNRTNATLYREWICAFDSHLSLAQMEEVAERFAQSLASEGMVVHYAIHDEKNKNGNFHAHFLAPMRSILPDGTWQSRKTLPRGYVLDELGNRIPVLDKNGEQKRDKSGRRYWVREPIQYTDAFNDPRFGNVDRWRNTFAAIENEYLPSEYQVDCRSYLKQGIDRIPGKHLGKAASNLQRKLDAQVDALPPQVRDEYVERIIEQIKKDYRKAYYSNSRNVAKSKKAIQCAQNLERIKLQEDLRNQLQKSCTYTPHREYRSDRLTVRDRNAIEMAFVRVLEFLRKLLFHQNCGIPKIEITERIQEAERNVLIVYSTGMTLALENRLLQGQYAMESFLLQELGKEIWLLEEQIKNMKEESIGDDVYDKLNKLREQIDQLGGNTSTATRSDRGVGIQTLDTARRISELAEWFEESNRRTAEAAKRTAEFSGRSSSIRKHQTQKRVR